MIRSNCRFTLKPNGRVFMRVRSKGMKDTTIGLEVFAEKEKWDNQRAKDRSVHNVNGKFYPARVINIEIEKAENIAKAYFSYCDLNNITPDSKALKDELEKELKPKVIIVTNETSPDLNLPPFISIFERFKTEMGMEKNWGSKTFCLYKQIWDQLLKFRRKVKSEDIDKKFLNEFKTHLIKQKYENTTMNRRLRCLKTILRWAKEQGYKVNDEALNYRSNLVEPRKEIVFLRHDELTQLENHTFPEGKNYLTRARDFLLFMCYTSLRYSDLKNLKKAAITEDGYIQFAFAKKTKKNIKIPLVENAKRLIEKYIHQTPGENVFPVPSDQKLNDYIQEAAKEAGLDREIIKTNFHGNAIETIVKPLHEWISCHTGRKTFICISLKIGIPQNVVMKITGHADYNAMRPYIESCDDTVKDEISKWEIDSVKTELHSLCSKMTEEQIKQIVDYAKQLINIR